MVRVRAPLHIDVLVRRHHYREGRFAFDQTFIGKLSVLSNVLHLTRKVGVVDLQGIVIYRRRGHVLESRDLVSGRSVLWAIERRTGCTA